MYLVPMIPPAQKAQRYAKQVRLLDVAEKADVSTASVSLFLSTDPDKQRRVGKDAQIRISEAVKELGYTQNKAASQLRRSRSDRICVVLSRLGVPFADELIQSVERVARQNGFNVLITTANTLADWKHVLDDVASGLADGVLADATELSADEISEAFEPLRVIKPCVIRHPDLTTEGFSISNYERTKAFKSILEYIEAKGHKTIAYVSHEQEVGTGRRFEILQKYIADTGAFEKPFVLTGAGGSLEAAEAARAILAQNPRPTVVLADSDRAAITIIAEFTRSGLSIPNDIAVIGCGNIENAKYCNPKLTTIGPRSVSLDEETRHLINCIVDGENKVRHFSTPWELFIRESG